MKQVAIRPLTAREIALLNEAEEVIAAGLTTFIDVGGALLTINEGRLYRRDFATFDEYCTAKWQIGRAYAYRLMEAVRTLLTLGDTGVPLPTNEAQARALAGVPEELRTEVWQKAHERTDGQPTAAAVRAAAEETAGAGLGGPAPAPNSPGALRETGEAGRSSHEITGPASPTADQPGASSSAPVEAEPERGVATSPGAAAGAGACAPAPAPEPPDTNASGVPGDPEPVNPPAGEGEQGGPVPSPAGPSCEKCRTNIDDDGYRRCASCDPDGMHTAADDGTCRLCALLATVPDEYLPIQVGAPTSRAARRAAPSRTATATSRSGTTSSCSSTAPKTA
jgi:hypothetical protein